MKFVHTKNKTAYLLACVIGCLFVLAGCSSDDDAPAVVDVTIGGTISDFSTDALLAGVNVEGVYTSPGDADNPTTTTDITGFFSLPIKTNTAFYLHGTLAGYATINSEKGTVSTNESGEDIEMPTETEAQEIIDTAFGVATTPLQNVAWLVVFVEDENGNEVNGVSVSYLSALAPADFVYTNCDGTDSGGEVTTGAPCADDRAMYIAYFNAEGDASVSVAGQTKIAPMRLGEITVLEYEVAAAVPVPDEPTPDEPLPDQPSAGQLIYDAQCASCHSAGSYDTDGAFGDVAGTGSQLQADVPLTYLAGSMTMVIRSAMESEVLKAAGEAVSSATWSVAGEQASRKLAVRPATQDRQASRLKRFIGKVPQFHSGTDSGCVRLTLTDVGK